MKVLLELLRIAIIFFLLGSLGAMLLTSIYSSDTIASQYTWLGIIALIITTFVVYRNKLQFSGWFQSEKSEKLPKRFSNILLSIAAILFISPFLISMFIS